MSLQVFYTPQAKETLTSVYNFISNNYGLRVAEKFLLKTERTINLIADHPLMFKPSLFEESVRIGLISKQTSIFYRVHDKSIQLLFFWDNRQEPL
ncbi:MAG: type II toxin-antitoxin system RelE/ParE family toxin [Sphingobacteriaceae bacterium]|nr:MAG: type II toxin-antitoxin system RelE/ParE family toxin [Sphingobacteriaceae bacterium]